MKKENHVCPNCRAVEKRDPNLWQYCGCNPQAPFRMYSETINRIASDAVNKFRSFIR